MRSIARNLVATLVAFALSSCCCCGHPEWLPPTVDDEGASAEAKRYFEAHARELRARGDAGMDSDACVSGLGALAADVAVAVVSRGHAGGNSAAEVQIDPGACFERVVVVVVLTAGVWHGVRAVAYDAGAHEVARTGEGTPYEMYVRVGASDDVDLGSDELF